MTSRPYRSENIASGCNRNSRTYSNLSCNLFLSHLFHNFGTGTDKRDIVFFTLPCKLRILGEHSISGMDSFGTYSLSQRNYDVHIQIAVVN